MTSAGEEGAEVEGAVNSQVAKLSVAAGVEAEKSSVEIYEGAVEVHSALGVLNNEVDAEGVAVAVCVCFV